MYNLVDWIDIKQLDWYTLSSNPNAIYLLEQNPRKIDWMRLSGNPSAIHLLEANPKKIDWMFLSTNSSSIRLFEKNMDKIGSFEKTQLSTHSTAIPFLKKNPNMINWSALSINPFAMEILEKNQDKIDWSCLSLNPSAIELLKKNKKYINWYHMFQNPNAIELILEEHKRVQSIPYPTYPLKEDWEKECEYNNIMFLKNLWDNEWISYLCANKSKMAMNVLKQNMDRINGNGWIKLSSNPFAIELLERRSDKIIWDKGCWYDMGEYTISTFPSFIDLIKKNLDKVNWRKLCRNPLAIKILKENHDASRAGRATPHLGEVCKIDWSDLSSNPAIFEIDYDFLRKRMDIIRDELMEKTIFYFE